MNWLTLLIYFGIIILPYFLMLVICFRKSLRFSLKGLVLCFLAAFLGLYLLLAWLLFFPVSIQSHPISLMILFVSLESALMLIVIKGYTFFQMLFLVLMFKSHYDIINLFLYAFSPITDTYITQVKPEVVKTALIYRTVFTVITALALLKFLHKLLKPLMDDTKKEWFWNILWAIPFIHSMLYDYWIVPKIGVICDSVMDKLLFPASWMLLVFATYCILVWLIDKIKRSSELETRLKLSSIELDAEQRQFQVVWSNIETVRRMNHDMRHYLLLLLKYAQEGDCPGIQKSIQEYLDELPTAAQGVYCKDSRLNALLSYYEQKAKKANIQMKYTIRMEGTLSFGGNDLFILIANLLENAVEASRKTDHPYINCRMQMPGPYLFFIVVENDYAGTIRERDGVFYSSKEDRRGVGILSVKRIAEKYNGVAKFEYTENKFKASVLANGNGKKQ